jgi:hypothetical protein
MAEPPRPKLPLATPVGREPTLVRGFPGPFAPGTKQPLPQKPRAPVSELEAVTEIQRHPSRQDDRSEPTETPVPPVGVRRERLPERRVPRSMSPAPWDPRASSPELKREVERHGDRLVPAPVSPPSLPPTPSVGAVRVQVGDVDVRVGSSVTRKLLPWMAPVLLSLAGTAIGYAKGYFEGLAAAGRRVAAVEEAVRLNAEGDARLETRTTLEMNRAFVLLKDHDSRIPKLQGRIEELEESRPKIQGIAPK